MTALGILEQGPSGEDQWLTLRCEDCGHRWRSPRQEICPRCLDRAMEAAEPAQLPDPLPIVAGPTELPEFPVDTLPDWMGAWAVDVAHRMQVPVDLPAVLGVVAASVCATGKLRIEVAGNWRETVNLYAAVAMPPGAGKSPVFKAMTGPLYAAEARRVEAGRTDVAQNEQARRLAEKKVRTLEDKAIKGEGSVEEAARAAAELADMPVVKPFRLIADDATPEALTALLAEQGGRIAVLSAEGGVFGMMQGRYSDLPNIDVYLKGWSGDGMVVDRIKREPLVIPEALLTVGLTIQPQVLEDLADKPTMHGTGLIARFMFSLPPHVVGWRDRWSVLSDVNRHAEAVYEEQLTAFAEKWLNKAEPVVLRFDQEARTAFVLLLESHEILMRDDGDLSHMREWTTKLQSCVVRVAALLHVLDGRSIYDEVDVDTLARAARIGSYWMEHAKAVHGMWGGSEVGRKAEAIRRRLLKLVDDNGRVTVRDIHRHMSSWFDTVDDLVRPLELLVDRGWLIPDFEGPLIVGRRGTESPGFHCHPKLSSTTQNEASCRAMSRLSRKGDFRASSSSSVPPPSPPPATRHARHGATTPSAPSGPDPTESENVL